MDYEVCMLDAAGPWLRLCHTHAQTQTGVDYRVQLTTTQPRFGGLRWWFLCPMVRDGQACGCRVGTLYLPPGGRFFGCRHCHCLNYTTSQESHQLDTEFRDLARVLGWDFTDVKRAMQRIRRGRVA